MLELGSTSSLVVLTTSFLSSAFPGLTRDPKLVKRFPRSFARASPDMASLSPLDSLHPLTSVDHGALLLIKIVGKKVGKMATRIHRENHDVQQTVPLITCEVSFG